LSAEEHHDGPIEMTGEMRGGLSEGWHTEQGFGAVRLGLRVSSLLHEEQSEYQKISVCESEFFGRILFLDDLIMLTERDEFVYHEMITHVPLCGIKNPRRVLVIGGGDCGCLREILKHESVERAVLCEIDERVTGVCREFFPWVRDVVGDPRVELAFADGVAHVKEHPQEYDLVIVDSTDPIGPAVNLFRREFYASVARCLKPGGVMVAQTESPFYSPKVLGRIKTELAEAFRWVEFYLGFIPTYPSGCWSWAHASNDRAHDAYFDEARAERLARSCRYYNPAIHRAAFALPNFARAAVTEDDSSKK
jgi:spermidine synthase